MSIRLLVSAVPRALASVVLAGVVLAGCADPTVSARDAGAASTIDLGLTPAQRRWTVIRPPMSGEPTLFSIWGESADHFFAVGTGGVILRATPSEVVDLGPPTLSFTRMQSPAQKDLHGIHGTSGSDVYAVGLGGTILHYDGNVWNVETPKKAMPNDPAFTTDLFGVFSYKSNAVAVGNGGTWIKRDKGLWGTPPAPLMVESLAAISGVSAEGNRCNLPTSKCDIYAVGATGFVFHYDEMNNWQPVSPNGFTTTLAGVFGSAPDNVYAVGLTGSILRKSTMNMGNIFDYGATVDPGCGSGPLPKAYYRNGVVTPSGAAVLIGWEGAITRLSESTCKGKPGVPGATDESGVTDHRLEGIWSFAKSGVIYITGAEGVIIRGE